uniref:Uncharacterized protein n=1 Tax=Pseudo-nitzschia multiseries DNA virus TaxID=2364897 RepID=A0A678W383_9VIRU|nr:conserved hypothetical protein [Pseudo-nitzschia multiseries DNA virus]
MTDNIVTPVGRFVSGSITDKRTTDYENRPLPEDKQTYQFGVAIRKDDPGIGAVFTYIHGVAASVHAAHPSVANFNLDGYSWKVKDGDKPNTKGVVGENVAGCYVFFFSSSYPVRTCDASNADIAPADVYRGCYVDMAINAANNGLQGDRAGIYLNPVFMRMVAHGKPILGGVDAATAFGNAAPAALPPGASATPLPGSAPSAAMTGAPTPAAPATSAPTPAAPATSAPTPAAPATSAPAPAHDFVQNATQQAAPSVPGLPGMPR